MGGRESEEGRGDGAAASPVSVCWCPSVLLRPLIPLYCSVLAVDPGVVITKVNALTAMSGAYFI